MIFLRISGGFQATPRLLIPADAATVILNQNHQNKPKEKSDANSVTLNMEGKDVLTGEDLSEKSLLVSRANDAFYNAYETADIKAMRMVWRKVHILVQCCHPLKKENTRALTFEIFSPLSGTAR